MLEEKTKKSIWHVERASRFFTQKSFPQQTSLSFYRLRFVNTDDMALTVTHVDVVFLGGLGNKNAVWIYLYSGLLGFHMPRHMKTCTDNSHSYSHYLAVPQ